MSCNAFFSSRSKKTDLFFDVDIVVKDKSNVVSCNFQALDFSRRFDVAASIQDLLDHGASKKPKNPLGVAAQSIFQNQIKGCNPLG